MEIGLQNDELILAISRTNEDTSRECDISKYIYDKLIHCWMVIALNSYKENNLTPH